MVPGSRRGGRPAGSSSRPTVHRRPPLSATGARKTSAHQRVQAPVQSVCSWLGLPWLCCLPGARIMPGYCWSSSKCPK
jgi:hypothetical protein